MPDKNNVVLVVDDSPDALTLIHDALELAGMDVLVALEGKQAIHIAQRMNPDIILLDAMMPVMDGFETCLALKEDPQLADIPVIFMTGLSDTEHVVKGLECGGVDYLTKPIKPNELLARIRVHLSNARLTRAAYSALDETGQVLVCVDEQGIERWATPTAYLLLARAGLNDDDKRLVFKQQIKQWLSHQPNIGQALSLTQLGYALEIKLISHQNEEWVLRLIDGERLTGAALLKQKLNLTKRESEVIYWIANGKTNREAAEILSMSPRTVNKHLEQIFQKLEVDNRTSAAGVALKILAQAEAL